MNHEAQWAFEKKNPTSANEQKEAEAIQGILEEEILVFDGASYVRGMYDGKVDGCASHSWTGDELPK